MRIERYNFLMFRDGGLRLKFCLIVIFMVLLLGCVSTTGHVGVFSKAAEELAVQVEKGYQLVETIGVQGKIAREAAEHAELSEKKLEALFKGLLEGSEDHKIRMKMIKQLRAYSHALGELSSANFREGIDKASKELYGVLTGFTETYKKASGKDAGIKERDVGIFATLVDAIGTGISEKKRKKAIKKVVEIADPAIQKICARLSKELPALADYVKVNLSTAEMEMKNYYNIKGKSLDLLHRIQYLKEIQRVHYQTTKAKEFFDDLTKGVDRLAKAHAVLRKAVNQKKFTTKELISQIRALVDFARSLREFYKGL